MPTAATQPPTLPFRSAASARRPSTQARLRSEEHTSELQSLRHLVCRLLLEKKKNTKINTQYTQTTNKRQRTKQQPPNSNTHSRETLNKHIHKHNHILISTKLHMHNQTLTNR